ncbi:condensation domain-containing protein [Streptomyces sp. NBC_00873]|uniref:condensation domain-containing protein n=1 Tax=unclassified Streptomyces TaxID=2593676 RepID=UPI00386AECE2|nr:condensation domain-containing protein [Streptomyces sp. NBC_00873]WSY96687.1 condensation domain-containing protein [Streptomyces sp. NBC_00873]WTA41539.1 condensation domain-containing protein [Streptomyces sp. NBC_00842]WTA48357.1 condensation domain-containing protein [Streptomyces sp. NBC_00842]
MTFHRFPHAPISVVVDPGSPPYAAPWDLELRGPLDAVALEHLLGQLTAGAPGRPAWQHWLLRHGPDHHTLRFSMPQGAPAAFVSGRIADRLTQPPPVDRPLPSAQRAAADETPARPQPVPDRLACWVAELRELARDSAEAQHWSLVAERRSRVARFHQPARVTKPGDGPDAAPAQAPSPGPREVRHTGFTLDEGLTERITHGLARWLALTTGQVLTGVFALALARWQGSDEVGFDVRSDPRTGRQSLRRQAGRLTDPYPVHLTLDPGLNSLTQLTALAGLLAACPGRAGGGAGFGACREWSPDPSLRRALRELMPAQACLTLDDPGQPLPGSARPVHGGAPSRPVYRVEVRAQIVDGRLHIGLDWVSDHAEGITDTSVDALQHLLRELLGELADAAPAAPIPPAFRATPQQSALYTGGDAQPGTGRHVEQLVWVWRGPLDAGRFTASWQSVFNCETVLRTAFTPGPEPLLVVHDRVAPEITRRSFHDGDWFALLERDRLRGFDLCRPGALRFTLLEPEQTQPAGTVAPTRILVTYHRALLDTWSAHLLLREFYRAYLAGGTLPGGERRPDLRDYTAWVAAQDLEPAWGFWARIAPPDGAASRPGRSAGTTGLTGIGRARLRLDPVETTRLARWAGTWGTAESSVLQAVWAMLIYRASGATGPAPVCFAVTVSGRGIPLDGAARMAGPLRNPLPMSVEVDPAGTVPRLLRQLRDRTLDMAAYEWVPADWIRAWIRAWGRSGAVANTVIVFEDPPHPWEGLEAELAAHGIHAEFPGTLPARSVLPIGLLAHHDSAGGLVLTGVHDRALLDEDAAAELLAQSAMLLRALPLSAGESTTVGEALKLLEGSAVPRMAEAPGAGRDTPLVTLRAARQDQAGTICLIPAPGAPETCYDLLARTYPGPQELLVLTTGPDADGAEPVLAALGTGRSLLLAGFSGAGALACDIARRIVADGGRPPRVVIAGAAADEWERARNLAGALQAATGPAT